MATTKTLKLVVLTLDAPKNHPGNIKTFQCPVRTPKLIKSDLWGGEAQASRFYKVLRSFKEIIITWDSF